MARQFFRPFLIMLSGCAAFTAVSIYEPSIVWIIWQNPWPLFRDYMSQSLFEGGAPGASDIGVGLAIICFLMWLYERKIAARPKYLSTEAKRYIWTSGLVTSLLAIHSLKWIISRARPKIFFSQINVITNGPEQLRDISWAGFMPFDGPRGYSFNSFPSGHTASCALLLTFCYLIAAKRPIFGYFYGIFVFIFCALMAIARSMAGMHWLSDSVASFFMTWFIVDTLYSRMKPDMNQAVF